MSTVLADGQYELLPTEDSPSGLVFGAATKILVSTNERGDAKIVDHDQDAPRGDGTLFGRDFRGSRNHVLSGHVNTYVSGEGWTLKDQLEDAWLDDDARQNPGVVAVLRYRSTATRIRRVYGRPRKIAVTSGAVNRGWAPFTAEFKGTDHLYYSDQAQSVRVAITAASAPGFRFPVTFPAVLGKPALAQGDIVVGGQKLTPIVAAVHGPITTPVVRLVGGWTLKLNITLAYDEIATLDARQWQQYAITNRGVDLGDLIDPITPRFCDLTVPPGPQEFVLTGTDPSGTAYADISWRPAWASF